MQEQANSMKSWTLVINGIARVRNLILPADYDDIQVLEYLAEHHKNFDKWPKDPDIISFRLKARPAKLKYVPVKTRKKTIKTSERKVFCNASCTYKVTINYKQNT